MRDCRGDDGAEGERHAGGSSGTERAELAAFFRELGLGWDYDAESLIDRLADARGAR